MISLILTILTPSYLKISCLSTSYRMTNGSLSKHHTATIDVALLDTDMEEAQISNKRTTEAQTTSNQKKSKGTYKPMSLYRDPSLIELWYGFPVMESLAYDAGLPPLVTTRTLDELTQLGYRPSEAQELLSARMAFPRIEQKLWPTARPDKIAGQHVNVTQLPFDIEVHPTTYLSLDYHIMLHFGKPINPFSQDTIMEKVLQRLHTMDILVGDQIGEPVAVLCHGPRTDRVWSGMVKIHLKNPDPDGIGLLQGTRIFAIP